MNEIVDPAGTSFTEGTIIGDHFRLLRRLGAGGMGEVYLAENLNLPDKRYAVKVLRKGLSNAQHYANLLQAEAQRQARLDHDNIVQIYDYFHWEQQHCLVLAFVDGTTLADMIDAEAGGLKEARALELMLGILKALNHAHEHGVLHCDVKPANVLVDTEQRVRVTDFGIARDLRPTVGGERRAVVGTPAYMSPEQINAPDQVDHRSDVYSAGVVLFEMLTGRLPFRHDDEGGGVEYPQLTMEPADIRDFRPDLSPHLARIVATALQRDPMARFQGCIEFQRAIEHYRRLRRFKRTWLPAIAVTSVAAVVGAIWVHQWKLAVEERAAAQRQEAERIALLERMESEARARKSIEASIVSGIKQLGSLCRESQNLKTRQQLLATAASAGFNDLADKFRKQVADIEQNMVDYANGYTNSLTQLARFDAALVKSAIDAHPRQDAESGRLLTTLRADHDAALTRQVMPDTPALLATCTM